MARWQPDAQERLQHAAMTLFLERGYDEVTVAEIADRAGLTRRTYFNYFADKREVLFSGAATFEREIIDAVLAAPAAVSSVDVVMGALGTVGAALTAWGEPVRQRQRVVESATELRERELIKMDALVTALADALHQRGVERLTATLVAQVGVAVYRTAFQQWAESSGPRDLAPIMDDAIQRIRAAVGPAAPLSAR